MAHQYNCDCSCIVVVAVGMPNSLQTLISNRLAYVELMSTFGRAEVGSEKLNKLMGDTVLQFLGAFKSVKKLQEEDVINIQKLIASSKLSETQQGALLEAMDKKVNHVSTEAQRQTLLCFDKYLTAGLASLSFKALQIHQR